MKLFTLLSISFIWGQLSTQFFFRSWTSFLGIICCLMGLFRRSAQRKKVLGLLITKISETVFFGLALFTGFYVLYYHFQCGKTQAEVLVFLISVTVRLFFVLPRLSTVIDNIWNAVMGAEKTKPDK